MTILTQAEKAARYVRKRFKGVPAPYTLWLQEAYLAGAAAGRCDYGRELAERGKQVFPTTKETTK